MPKPSRSHALRKRPAFLEALAAGATVADAVKLAGVGYRTVYTWREKDPAFAADWEAAYQQGGAALAAEAHRRAVDGVDEPIVYQGKVVGHAKRYSDTLLIMLLKARDPETYCDRARLAAVMRRWAKEDSSAGGGNTVPADSILDLLQQIAKQKAAALADSD
jgi:hypothetical protein